MCVQKIFGLKIICGFNKIAGPKIWAFKNVGSEEKFGAEKIQVQKCCPKTF